MSKVIPSVSRLSLSSPLAVALAATLSVACGGGGGGAAPAPGQVPAPNAPQPPVAAPALVRLWVPNYNAGELRAWNVASLQADRTDAPDIVITLPAGSRPNATAFDATGALWVTDNLGSRLFKFGRNQIQATGTPTPQVVIESNGQTLANAAGLAFDRSDNLWVTAGFRLEMFTPATLAQSGTPAPSRTLQYVGADTPADLLFDAAGNLWLTNSSDIVANNFIAVFAPAQQAAGGNGVVPRLRLTSPGFARLEGLRFDAAGNLWVASNDGLSVARFSPASVAVPAADATRAVAPDASLESDADDTANGRTVRKPGGLAFDRDGNLFLNSERGLAGGNDSAVLRFNAAQLAFTGGRTVSAAVVIARSTSNPGLGGLCFETR